MATTLEELLISIGIQDDTADGRARIQGGLKKMAVGAGLAGAALGAAFAVGVESAMDISAAQTSLETQFDLTGQEAKRAGDIAGDVFQTGFGDSVEQVATSIGAVNNSIGGLGDFTDKELTQMSKSAQALGKTFGVDVTEATDAVGQLMKTGLVSDANEGFDLVTKAMESVPASLRDDMLPTIEEYSTQFRKVGVDGETAMGLLQQGVKAGARDIDTVADTIKEFSIRAVDGSKEAGEAFKMLELDADDMTAQIGKGGKDAEEGLALVLDKLREMEDPVAREAAAVGLFGTKAEDMGDALFALDPATAAAATGMDDAGGSAKDLTDKMEDDPAQQMASAMRTLKTTLGETLLPVLVRFGEFIQNNQGLIKKLLIPALIALAVIFVILTAATIAWSIALLANPIVLIILAIIAFIATLVLLIAKWDVVKAHILMVWRTMLAGLKAGWDWLVANVFAPIGRFFTQTIPRWAGMVKDAVLDAWQNIKTRASILVSGLLKFITDKWNGFIRFFSDLPGKISRKASGMWDGIKSSFRGVINSVIGWWNNLSFTIGGGSVLGVDIPKLTLNTPNIPFLADGGIITSPTLAMIGEGGEDEAVMPLSKLDQMIEANSFGAPSTFRIQPVTSRVVIDVTGSDTEMKRLISRIVQVDGEGEVQEAFT